MKAFIAILLSCFCLAAFSEENEETKLIKAFYKFITTPLADETIFQKNKDLFSKKNEYAIIFYLRKKYFESFTKKGCSISEEELKTVDNMPLLFTIWKNSKSFIPEAIFHNKGTYKTSDDYCETILNSIKISSPFNGDAKSNNTGLSFCLLRLPKEDTGLEDFILFEFSKDSETGAKSILSISKNGIPLQKIIASDPEYWLAPLAGPIHPN